MFEQHRENEIPKKATEESILPYLREELKTEQVGIFQDYDLTVTAPFKLWYFRGKCEFLGSEYTTWLSSSQWVRSRQAPMEPAGKGCGR